MHGVVDEINNLPNKLAESVVVGPVHMIDFLHLPFFYIPHEHGEAELRRHV